MKKEILDDHDMLKSRSKPNKRLKGPSHVGGPVTSSYSNSTNPNEISDEEVKTRRTAREDREDIAAAFCGY